MNSSTIRRLYADIIEGRSRVRMATPVQQSRGIPPIFIIGAYRSGTTLLRLLLDSHSRLACPPETTFMAPLERVVSGDWEETGFDGLGFDRGQVVLKLREFVSYFYESYAASTGKTRWVDKSPEYVWHLSFLRELFPNAYFLMLIRYPLDQAYSHVTSGHDLQRRLQGVPDAAQEDRRLAAVHYWAKVVDLQLDFVRRYPSSSTILRYEDLCLQPERVLTRVLEGAGEAFEPSMVNFGKKRHDFGLSDDKARTSGKISLRTGQYRNWDQGTVQKCLRITARQREALGWGSCSPEECSRFPFRAV